MANKLYRWLWQKPWLTCLGLAGLLTSSIALMLWTQPLGLVNFLSEGICPGAVYAIPTQQKMVALTIDDGPDDQHRAQQNTTQQILQVLAHHQAHATFFLISDRIIPENRALIAAMVQQGHELGNHLTADRPSIELPLATFAADLRQAEQAILAAASMPAPRRLLWLRPGGGRCNLAMVNMAWQQGYRLALGSRWPYDTSIPSSAFATQQILATVHPGDIIVLHDHGPEGAWGQRTVETLSQVLPELQRRGYQVVTLSQLVAARTPKVFVPVDP